MKVGVFLLKHILKIALIVFTVMVLFPSNSSAATQFTSPYTTVKPDKEWKITFNQAVNAKTVSNSTVYVTDSAGKPLTNVVNVSNTNEKVVVIKSPKNGYEYGKTYTLHIAKSVAVKNSTKTLNDKVTMQFVVEEKSPTNGGNDDEPSNEFDSSYLLNTWNATIRGMPAKVTFHGDSSLSLNVGLTFSGSYSLNGTQLNVRAQGYNLTGEITVISDNEFTVTEASGASLRFTR